MYGSCPSSSDYVLVNEILWFHPCAVDTLSKACSVFKTFLQSTLLGFLALETQGQSASIRSQLFTSQDFPVCLQLPMTLPHIHIKHVTSSPLCRGPSWTENLQLSEMW